MGDKNNESTPKEKCDRERCAPTDDCDTEKNNDSSLNKPQTINDSSLNKPQTISETITCEPLNDQGPDTDWDETIKGDPNQKGTNQDETNQNETDRDETIKDDPNQKETYQDEANQNDTDRDETIKDGPNQKETYQDDTNQNDHIKPPYISESGKHCQNDGQPESVTEKFVIQPKPVSQMKYIEKVVQPEPITATFFIQPEPVSIFEQGELIDYCQPEQYICRPEEYEKCETASEPESDSDIQIIHVQSVTHDVTEPNEPGQDKIAQEGQDQDKTYQDGTERDNTVYEKKDPAILSPIGPAYDSESMTAPDETVKNETDQHKTVQENQDQDKNYQDGTVYGKKDPAILSPIGPAYDSESMTTPDETVNNETDQHNTDQENQDQDKNYQDGTENDNTVYKKKDTAKTLKCEILKMEIIGETGKCDPPKGGPAGPDGPSGPDDPSDQEPIQCIREPAHVGEYMPRHKEDPAILRPIGPVYDSESMNTPDETYKNKADQDQDNTE